MKPHVERVSANPRVERATTLLRAVGHEARSERLTFMAGSIAYNAFVSLLPLLLLLVSVVSTVGNRQLETSLLGITQAVLTTGASEVLIAEVRTASPEASVLGAALLVWGSLRIFRSLDAAFSDIYETSTQNTFVDKMSDAVVVLATILGVALVAVVLESQLGIPTGMSAAWVVSRLVLVVGIAVALYPMYYLFPDEPGIEPLEVVPGLAFTAFGLVTFHSLFQVYVAIRGGGGGVLASILLFLTWLYFSGLIVLLGGAVNATFSNRSRDVNVRPLLCGVPPDDEWSGVGGGVTRGASPDDLERLANALRDADEVGVVVDDEPVELSPPREVESDLDPSGLPFRPSIVGIRLEWEVQEEG